MNRIIIVLTIVSLFSCWNKENAEFVNQDTLTIFSASMGIDINNIVITPNLYEDLGDLPVIYLLHGAAGNYTDWRDNVYTLNDFCDNNNIIIVCPDGGYNSWYFDSPIDSSFMYETYITEELIMYVDSLYPTLKSSNSRAITGLSMGGHGALYLSIKHQDIFGAAGSMSGALDIRPFLNNWNISDRIGTIDEFPLNWEENTVTNMIDDIKNSNLSLIFDCGKDDFFFEVNNIFHQKLLDNNIEHIYNVRDGSHNWNYWSSAVNDHLIFFNNFFKNK